MNRRDFLGSGIGAVVATGCMAGTAKAAKSLDASGLVSPRETKLVIRPVMTNIIHTGVWEGPCRWRAVSVANEKAYAESGFAQWSKQIADQFGAQEGMEVLPPVHVTFSENFQLKDGERAKLTEGGQKADVAFVSPRGASVMAFEVGKELGTPIIMKGLSCRTVDIAAYTRSMGQQAYVPANDEELHRLLSMLRARKVFQQTRVLFPTDRGLPPVASVASVNDPKDLEQRYGIHVTQISYAELAREMDITLASEDEKQKAEVVADELIRNAQQTHLSKDHVVRGLQFYNTVKRLMVRHDCNAFTIECFEFCSSKLPEKWKITPCLIHTLLKDQGHASSCEADFGGLLSMRLLMSVSQKSSHLGNTFLRAGGVLGVNHSAAGLRMNGFDQPPLPYKLGRFVESGWGTKAVVDFMNNEEKRVTVVRIDPTATKMLVMRGKLVGSDGWEGDKLGCSVEARIVPIEGNAEQFIRKQLDYGNHLIWVYGHYVDEMQQLGEMLDMDVEVVGGVNSGMGSTLDT